MPRKQAAQLNIRSEVARARVRELMRRTGLTATEIIEDALRAYTPPAEPDTEVPPGLMRVGKFLVIKAREGRPPITMEETNTAIEAARYRDDD